MYLVVNVVIFLVSVSVLLLLFSYAYFKYCFTYWRRRGVPSTSPTFPTGNITSSVLGRESFFVCLQKLYNRFKEKKCMHCGVYFFNGPVYMPIDLTLIKHILLIDFENFIDRGIYFDAKAQPISAHLFAINGQEWKTLRTKLTPAFSSSKVKNMFGLRKLVAEDLIRSIERLAENDDIIDIRDRCERFSVDIIASCAFGVESNTLKLDQNEYIRTIHTIFKVTIWDILKLTLQTGLTNLGQIAKLLYRDQGAIDFFVNLVLQTTDYRIKNNIVRNDFLDLLNNLEKDKVLTSNEVIAQTFLFFLAGYETSANTMAFCLHELAHHQDVQDKLRDAIFAKLGKDPTQFQYDELMQLPYLDYVVKEALRLYPIIPYLNRVCLNDYQVPNTNVIIEKGTPILIPALAVQYDEEYYSNPTDFDPSRFERDKNTPQFAFLTFGEGPRNCIGKRFGLLEVKLGAASIIANYKVLPETPRKITFARTIKNLALSSEEVLKVRVVPIKS